MSYTDMTSNWVYKKLLLWKDMDIHAENSADAWEYFKDRFFYVVHDNNVAGITKNTWSKMNFNQVVSNPFGTWNNTSKRWTPVIPGKYLVGLTGTIQPGSGDWVSVRVALYKDGSIERAGTRVGSINDSPQQRLSWSELCTIINVTSSTSYYEPYMLYLGSTEDGNSMNFQDGTSVNPRFFALRLH